jgi:hypothetical protein
MRYDLERLLENIDGFDRLLKSKGYEGYFLTNAACPGRFRESIMDYIYGIIAGTESHAKTGLSFSTYLRWSADPEYSSIHLNMDVDYSRMQSFQVREMTIRTENIYGETGNEKKIENIQGNHKIPDCNQAMNMVLNKPKKQSRIRKI